MAVKIITNIDKYIFSAELQIFQFSTDSTSSGVSITAPAGNVILSCRYVPDANNIVTIYDLQKLVEPYISETIAMFLLKIENEAPITLFIVKSSVRVNSPASYFLQNCYLSTLQGEKFTTIGRYEPLSLIATEECTVTATCTYFHCGELIDNTVNVFDGVVVNVVTSFDVSAKRFVNIALGDLVYYKISAGKRQQLYCVVKSLPPADPAILFKNCFDCLETIYLTGAKTYEPEYTRSSVYINGSITNYDIDEKVFYKASTGPLPIPLIAVACDLARSRLAWVIDKLDAATLPIVITACETKYSNEDDSIPNFTFTYRLTSRISANITVESKPILFDHTFDKTYG